MSSQWPLVRLAELLRRSDETSEPEPDRDYREITVRLWGKGVMLRGVVPGAQITGQRRFVARAGQFILSRIDARNGALGIVPQELEGALVTNDFPLFEIQEDRLLPGFLGWLCRTRSFVEACRKASEGTTNRVRVQEQLFLEIEIPLPPLPEQRRVVARIEGLAKQIEEARFLRREAMEEAEALIVSVHLRLANDRRRTLGQVLRLDEDAVLVSPLLEYPQVGIRSFGGGLFAKPAVSGAQTTYKTFNRLYEGALVMSQVKGWEGAVAICEHSFSGWFASPEYRTFRCQPREARPGYLSALVATSWFWSKLSVATRGVGARRERTRPEQFLAIEIPMPDVADQAVGERIFAELSTARSLRLEGTIQLESVLPGILVCVFKGSS